MDERSASRVAVDKPAQVVIGDRDLGAIIYNLSTDGCMMDSISDDVRGQSASIKLKDRIIASGTIVWQRGCHQGVRFTSPLASAVVEELGFTPALSSYRATQTVSPPHDVADLRQHRRVIVDRHVICEGGGSRGPVLLYDLSVGGCMFEADGQVVNCGEPVEITLAGSPYPAVVVWAINGNIGAAFCESLHPAIVEHYGFSHRTSDFQSAKPRDKFGRPLPPLSKICA